ncbi:MAG: DUF554 domain-containing protein [Eubacteriales bacterium]|nr:DUF554 domain-containing protein [Eubacteriales bacterium]
MPIGVIANVLAVAIGGILGAVAGEKLPDKFKNDLNLVFGSCAMCIGISSIVLMKNMPAVIFAAVIGSSIGLLTNLGDKINSAALLLEKPISKLFKGTNRKMPESEFQALLVTALVLFCASGTGIYGCLDSGMTGDHSILISKSILDLFTALVFACSLGYVTSIIAIPQFIIFLILFMCAKMIFPLTTPDMIADFKACGGILMIATGFRIAKIKMFPIADMLPAMVLVMPLSWFWTSYILPLVS